MVFKIHAAETVAGKTFQRKRAACSPETSMLEIAGGQNMFGFKRNKETERFYLLPGQGGRAYRRKQKFMLTWAVVVGLLVAAALGTLMYFLNKPKL
jgi:hypothetical protein